VKSLAIVALFAARAAADPMDWTGAQLQHQTLDNGIVVERRSMNAISGYTQLQLVAVVDGTRTVLVENYTMCDTVKPTSGGLVVEICTERYADTVESTRWQLHGGVLTRGKTQTRSPYLEAARRIVRDLRDGKVKRAVLQHGRLGDLPDGQASIAWWWEAHWLWAERGRGLRRRIERILEIEDGVASLLAADLAHVPRVGIDEVVVQGEPPPIASLLDDAARTLARGSTADRAVAGRLVTALQHARQP
jgi:hypothetical protein